MGRKAIEIDRAELTKAIHEAESLNTFNNHNQLFLFVSTKFNVSPIIIRNRCLKWNIELKTPKGKRGRQAGDNRGFLGTSKKKNVINAYKLALPMAFPEEGLAKRVYKAINGSIAQAVALKCYDCAGGSRKEVGLCVCVSCPLWNYRPWKRHESLTTEGRDAIMKGAYDDEDDTDGGLETPIETGIDA